MNVYYGDELERYKAIADITTDRLREICAAERDGRLAVLPVRPGGECFIVDGAGHVKRVCTQINHEGEIMDCVRYAPTIDAAPVVRCGECRFRNTSWYDKRDMLESFCRWDRDESPNDDDFCSYGAKMEDE